MRLEIVTLAIAQLFDFGTFVVMVARHGIPTEANPVVAAAFDAYGPPFAAVVKVALLALVLSIIAILTAQSAPSSHRRLAVVIVALGIIAGLIGGLSNALVIG